MHSTGAPGTKDDGGLQQQAQQARILVVDDNDDNRYTLTLYLDLEGYTSVEIAHDGEEAIALLKDKPFDLVLLDVMMPKVDGYAVLSWMKSANLLDDLPVIMISALNEIDSIVRCIELGALDYLMKPFNPVLLKARITSSLEKKQLRDEINAHLARLTEELEAARRLQLGMVPRAFPAPTPAQPLDVFAMMEPAREVGGDLYDFFYAPDGTFCFLVGDVSGKGMPAALFMARTKSLIRLATELMQTVDGTTVGAGEIVKRVNRELCQNNDDMMFVTLFFGMLQPLTGELQFCNAGHNPPFLVAAGDVQPIDGGKGAVLGVDERSEYTTASMTVAPGSTIYLYTDGVSEAANRANELFSEERLAAILRDKPFIASSDLVHAVSGAVQDFVGGVEQSDDITMMAVRRL